jgi:hypothetical protein
MAIISTPPNPNIVETDIATSMATIGKGTDITTKHTDKGMDPEAIIDTSTAIRVIIGVTRMIIETVIMVIGMMINTTIKAIRVILARVIINILNMPTRIRQHR